MPPRSRKSLSLWFACDVCKALVSSKDLQTHSKEYCPPDFNSWKQGFILDGVLYSFLDKAKNEDFCGIPKEDIHNELVLLSQTGMQLCKISIGEPVVVVHKNYCEIKTAWPTSENTLTSVSLTLEAINVLNWTVTEPIIVKKMKSLPLLAKEIYFDFSKDALVSEDKLTALTSVLKTIQQNRIIFVGKLLNIPFYGNMVKIKITNIKSSFYNRNDEQVENINLDMQHFYKWTYTSKILFNDKNIIKEELCYENTLTNIGGYKSVLAEMKDILSITFGAVSFPNIVPSGFGILLHGPNGSGKTAIVKALANDSGKPIININSGELFSKYYGVSEAKLRSFFDEALKKTPSIIILEDLDNLCSKTNNSDQEKRLTSTLLVLLDSLQDKKVLVLATTSKLHLIDPALRRPGRLDREIELPVPTPLDRFDILSKQLLPFQVNSSIIKELADMTHGFVAADLSALISRACIKAAKENRDCLLDSDLFWALTQVKPSAMREVLVQVPNIRWSDIGGQEELKLKLRQSVEWPLHHPDAFSRLGISPPRGVLMFGPPGCSKTMIAKALATESKLNFLSIKGSELFSKWVGESERAVRELFKRARSVAPSIIFFDELDAIGGERRSGGSSGSNVEERVLSQLLTELDGVEPLENVIIVAATNRPDRIDKALIRPGRLDCLLYVPLPDLHSRRQILQLQFRKTPIGEDVQVDELATNLEGYSGAEIVAVCHEAAVAALQENLNASVVRKIHFISAIQIITPRTPSALLNLYKNYMKS